MKKICFYLGLFIMMLLPFNVFALEEIEENFEVVSKTEKYYKTTTIDTGIKTYTMDTDDNYISLTEEITEEEYNNASLNSMLPNSSYEYVETSYKKLTSYILVNGDKFRYQAVLDWKTIPKVRSYDTIAIGHYASVKPIGNVFFNQYYCKTDNNCTTSTSYFPQTFETGSAATFKVPVGDLTTLKQTFYFDIQKAVDATVIRQVAAGDYAHAVKSIDIFQAKNFTVSVSGISFNNSVKNSYDDIQVAEATWSGSW